MDTLRTKVTRSTRSRCKAFGASRGDHDMEISNVGNLGYGNTCSGFGWIDIAGFPWTRNLDLVLDVDLPLNGSSRLEEAEEIVGVISCPVDLP